MERLHFTSTSSHKREIRQSYTLQIVASMFSIASQAPTCSPVGKCARSSCTFYGFWSDRTKTHRNKSHKEKRRQTQKQILKFLKPEKTCCDKSHVKMGVGFRRDCTLTNVATCTSGPVRTLSCRSIPESWKRTA